MATHADSITSPPSPLPRRRQLFAAATAVVIGAGITAGAAASVADLVPTEADRDLIALCDRYIATEMARKALYDGPDAIVDDDEANAQARPLFETLDQLVEQMDLVQAQTAEGVLARAKALFVENGDFGCSFDWRESTPGRLLALLLRDAERLLLAGRA